MWISNPALEVISLLSEKWKLIDKYNFNKSRFTSIFDTLHEIGIAENAIEFLLNFHNWFNNRNAIKFSYSEKVFSECLNFWAICIFKRTKFKISNSSNL